jgi:hypothetical protein
MRPRRSRARAPAHPARPATAPGQARSLDAGAAEPGRQPRAQRAEAALRARARRLQRRRTRRPGGSCSKRSPRIPTTGMHARSSNASSLASDGRRRLRRRGRLSRHRWCRRPRSRPAPPRPTKTRRRT